MARFATSRKTVHDRAECTRFEREARFHITELRLAALAYPVYTEKEVLRIAQDRNAEDPERLGAFIVLETLALQGRGDCLAALSSIAKQDGDPLKNIALWHLATADEKGAYKDLMQSRAREGVYEAVTALGRWPDPFSTSVLTEVYERGKEKPYPEGSASYMANTSREQLKLMESPNLTQELRSILGERARQSWEWQEWALGVAAQRGLLSELSVQLMNRLATGDRVAIETGAAILDSTAPGYGSLTKDQFYDDVLIAASRAGASLSEPQRRRLIAFGYLGDPLLRLEELVR